MCCRCWLPFWCGENIWTLLQQYPWLATSFHWYWHFWVIVIHFNFICDIFGLSWREGKYIKLLPSRCFSILLKSFVSGEEREEIFCGDKSSGGSCCCFSKESQPDHKMKYNFDFDKEAQPVHKLKYNLNSDKDSQPVHKLSLCPLLWDPYSD